MAFPFLELTFYRCASIILDFSMKFIFTLFFNFAVTGGRHSCEISVDMVPEHSGDKQKLLSSNKRTVFPRSTYSDLNYKWAVETPIKVTLPHMAHHFYSINLIIKEFVHSTPYIVCSVYTWPVFCGKRLFDFFFFVCLSNIKWNYFLLICINRNFVRNVSVCVNYTTRYHAIKLIIFSQNVFGFCFIRTTT